MRIEYVKGDESNRTKALADLLTGHTVIVNCMEEALHGILNKDEMSCTMRVGTDSSYLIIHVLDDDGTIMAPVVTVEAHTYHMGSTLVIDAIVLAKPFRGLKIMTKLSKYLLYYYDTVIFKCVSNTAIYKALTNSYYIESPVKDEDGYLQSSKYAKENCKEKFKYYEKGFKVIDMINSTSPYLEDYNNIQTDYVNEDKVDTTTTRAEEHAITSVGLRQFLLGVIKRRE